jgi:hypothetical protein
VEKGRFLPLPFSRSYEIEPSKNDFSPPPGLLLKTKCFSDEKLMVIGPLQKQVSSQSHQQKALIVGFPSNVIFFASKAEPEAKAIQSLVLQLNR